jgi:uncharacterized protein
LLSVLLIAFDFLLTLLGIILMIRLGRRLRPDLRPFWLAVEISIFFCFFADWVLLAGLSILQLSFGTAGLPLLLISSLRLFFFAPALILLPRQPLKRYAVALLVAVGLFQVALFTVEVDGFYFEPFRLGVTEIPIHAPAFLPDRSLLILQISDLHLERMTKREGEVLALARSLQPDIIVLTGDYVNASYVNDLLTLLETHQLLSRLYAPYGIYAVNGNLDSPPVMAALFNGLANIRVLNDELLPLPLPGGTLYILGVTLSSDRVRDDKALEGLMARIPPGAYGILLYHTPDLIRTAAPTGVDLYFAGHTHGGQVRLPIYGAIFTQATDGKKYEMGEYTVGPTTMYVSRGIGMGGELLPRMRFLCPPEMVLVELGNITP